MDNIRDFYKDKKALITGGLGFIGSTLAIRLAEYGADVLLVDSLIKDYGGNMFNIDTIKDKARVNISDVRDRSSMDCLVRDIDCLFNLAGTLSHIDSMRDPFTDLQINCVSQLSILEACRYNNSNVKIVFSGTRGQYGSAIHLPVDENHPQQPLDVNGINNMAGEWYHILYSRTYPEIRAASLRLVNTYGPRHQMKHHRQGIINWFIRQIIDGEEVKIFGDGQQVRDTNYIDDVVDALLLAMADNKADGEVFNLGGEPINLLDLVKKMIEIYGKGSYRLIEYPEKMKHIEVGDFVADNSKIKRVLGWNPKISLEEGLNRSFEYYEKYKRFYWGSKTVQ